MGILSISGEVCSELADAHVALGGVETFSSVIEGVSVLKVLVLRGRPGDLKVREPLLL